MSNTMSKRVKDQSIRHLSDEEVLALGGKIVSTSMIPAIWHRKVGRTFSRTMPLKERNKGHITPMGQNRSVLYWWRDEIERSIPNPGEKRGRPWAKHAEKSEE